MAQKGPVALRLWQFKTAYIDGNEFPIDDLAFLVRHRPSMRTLDVGGEQRLDVDEINQMRALEVLSIDAVGGSAGALRLAGLPNLRELTIFSVGGGERRLTIDWDGAPALESLSLEEPSEADIAAIATLPTLRELTLARPPRLPQLPTTVETLLLEGPMPPGPLGVLPVLRFLTLLEVTGLQSLRVFEGSGALEELEVAGSPGLASLDGVHVRDGAAVMLEDCPDLVDISALDGAADLELSIKECPKLRREGLL